MAADQDSRGELGRLDRLQSAVFMPPRGRSSPSGSKKKDKPSFLKICPVWLPF